MSEFTFLYRGRDTQASPEQMQKTMEKWTAWFKELGAKGHLKDIGQPLEPTGTVVKGKQKMVIDGPFAEAKDVVGGFTLIHPTTSHRPWSSRKAVRFWMSAARWKSARSSGSTCEWN
jgi:hypothetical protein